MRKNGLSGKKLLLEGNTVYKEKNDNKEAIKIMNILNDNKFEYASLFTNVNDKEYSYDYINGVTLEKVISMPIESTLAIIEIIKEMQKIYINDDKVIVHGDISPVNVVYNDQLRPIKIIDWDGSYFGSKYEDISYICWLWVNFGDEKQEHQKYIEQIKIIFKSLDYKLFDVKQVKKSIIKRINQDKNNIKNEERREEIKEWYAYTEKWVIDNWRVIENEFD